MNGRRLLGETLGEIAGSALDVPGQGTPMLQVTSIELDLPIDLRFARDGDAPCLIGDVPLMHLRTAFDPPPARFQITCVASPVEAMP